MQADYVEKLRAIWELKQAGAITEQEYIGLKAGILDKSGEHDETGERQRTNHVPLSAEVACCQSRSGEV